MKDENPFAAPRTPPPAPPPPRKGNRRSRESGDLPSSRYFFRLSLITGVASGLFGGGLIIGSVEELIRGRRDIPLAIMCLIIGIPAFALALRQFRTAWTMVIQDRKAAAHKARRRSAALVEDQEFSAEADTDTDSKS